MKRTAMLLIAMLIWLSLTAYETVIEITPPHWQSTARSAQYNVILEPGMPMLPYLPVKVLLPFGESYEGAAVETGAWQIQAEGIDIPIARQQLPISQAGQQSGIAEVANLTGEYPGKNWEYLGNQYYRGYQIALFNIYPYRYNAATRQLTATGNILLKVNSSFNETEAFYQANFHTASTETIETLQMMVQNPEARHSYSLAGSYRNVSPGNRVIDLDTPKKMIIITDAQRVPWFGEYSAWRASKGISNAIYTMEDILGNYPGVDNAEKVRNFIIHAYQTWAATATPLEYVILGGDDEIVPERGAYGQVGDTIDLRMPTDIYYSNLDGTWNANENLLFGEVSDDTDLIPEVHIGRFPAQSQAEFDNIFRKTRHYVDNNTWSNNIALFMGENLNWNPVTWGGDYKDDVALHLPDSYDFNTMYQRDGTYTNTGVWHGINNGAAIMNHMGHANEFFLIGQSNNTIESLQNTEYGFLYSQGCYPSAFDQRTSGDSESIGEHLVTASGALYAFIGNTRYGWYMPGGINGASQYYDRQYFIGMFEQNMPQLGKALTYSRLQNLNAALSNDVMRWCYYEVVLFGDPSVSVKAADPSLPYLSLDSYSFSDVEGDNNGEIMPDEIIRLYPVIANDMDWGTAYNVSVQVETGNTGIQVLDGGISIPQILPGGMSPVNNFIRLQMPSNMGYGSFNITVVVESQHPVSGNGTGERRFTAGFEVTLIDNRFPWETVNSGKSAPLIGNFSPEPGQEILYMDVFGNGYFLGNDGVLHTSFSSPQEAYINRSFASGNINAMGTEDLAFCSRTGKIYAITGEGSLIFSYNSDTTFMFSPVLADLDADGSLETIAGGMDGKVYAIRNNGTLMPGFPFDVGGAFQTEIAAVDFDNDGTYEIVAGGNSGNLYVITGNGVVRTGFPVLLNGAITGAPTITSNNRIVCATGTQMYIVDSDGQIVFSRAIDTHIAGGFAIGRINGDAVQDIAGISISGMLYVMGENGTDLPGFPLSVGVNFTCPPLLANLDNDPELEILLHSYVNSVYGYNHDGSQLSGFPFITSYNGSTPATLTDFDDNNVVKMVMGHSNGVLMLNLRKPASGLSPWITYRGGALRQGSFASTGFVGNTDEMQTPVVNTLKQNYPNPFTESTTIDYSTKHDAPVKLEVFNLKGQKVRSLELSTKKAGNHSLSWNGMDDRGRRVANGVYLYRLVIDNETQTRRMLLLK